MLLNDFSRGGLLSGLLLGLVVPKLTSAFWPQRPRVRHPLKIAEYAAVVLWDIVVANVKVAAIVLFKPNRELRPHFITIPLDIHSPEAITALAGTRSEEHTSELQSLMRISYAVFCLKKKTKY